ncbi:MAG: glycosyltransferase family 2 protein [Gammaproteobacteria bacterium]|nr:glycosyltransferase family 2 protein [Gammaproteobacteria bacterium]
MQKAAPRLSIGLPVLNGENYLARAIRSHLAQSFTDFELIISDNASTDETRRIAESFARLDRRVRYCRHATNRGAVWNFNHCFELARGEYFKWSAHDDVLDPTFCQKCIEILDANPDVVLCHSLSSIVDRDMNRLGIYDPGSTGTDHPRASVRFGARLRGGPCFEVFGIIRSSALRTVKPLQPFVGCDRALLAELAAAGRFATVREHLFFNGEHPQRSTRVGLRPLERLEFYVPIRRGTRSYPIRSLFGAYADIVRRRFPARADRIRCYGHMTRALFVRFNILRIMIEPLGSLMPWLYDVMKRRPRAFGGAPRRSARSAESVAIRPTSIDAGDDRPPEHGPRLARLARMRRR